MSELARAVVVHDVVNSRVVANPGLYPPAYRYVRGKQGDTIETSSEEVDRLEALGAVVRLEAAPVDPDADEEEQEAAQAEVDAEAARVAAELEAQQNAHGPFEAGQAGDDAIAHLKAEDAIAYVTQNPDEAQRVWRIERERSRGPRASVRASLGLDDEGNPLDGSAAARLTTPAGAAGPGGALQGALAAEAKPGEEFPAV